MKKTIKLIIIFAFILSVALLLVACKGNKHSLTYHAKVEPTCVEDGVKEYYSCSDCNKNFADKSASKELNSLTIAKLGHNGVFKGQVDATCVKNGTVAHYHCNNCNKNYFDEFFTIEVDVLEIKAFHTLIYVERVESTCNDNGVVSHYVCNKCNKKFKDKDASVELESVIILKEHKGGTEIRNEKAPTLTQEGYTGDTYCIGCGQKISSGTTVDKLTHIHNMQKTNKKEQTCTQNGNIEYYTCQTCSKIYEDVNGIREIQLSETVILASHKLTYNERVNYTCAQNGTVAHFNCSNCNKNFEDSEGLIVINDITIKASHNLSYNSRVNATCTANGTLAHYHCSNCNKNYSDAEGKSELSSIIIQASHNLTFNQKVEATCLEKGNLAHYHCLKCSKNFEDSAGVKEITNVIIDKIWHVYENGECKWCQTSEPTLEPSVNTYTRIDKDGTLNPAGDYILFGLYPQTDVTSTMSTALSVYVSTLPTTSSDNGWISYGYYQGSGYESTQSNTKKYMWYKDVVHTDNTKYRAVYFTSYRPNETYDVTDSGGINQSFNNYYKNNVYWFKFEPIKWRILSENNGEALIFSELMLDAQAFQNTYNNNYYGYYATDDNKNILTDGSGNNVLANNYAYSSIRTWLNNNFYNTSFDILQKEIILTTTVDNSASSTASPTNPYACENTNDDVFLLSYQEATNGSYGFSANTVYDPLRQKYSSDYAVSQGCNFYYDINDTENHGKGTWWLRSASYETKYQSACSETFGTIKYYSEVASSECGVAPALYINLGSSTQPEEPKPEDSTPESSGNVYKRVNDFGNESATGNYIVFGSYPQQDVTSNMRVILSSYVANLPNSSNNNGWTSYGYYKGQNFQQGVYEGETINNFENYMWYKDVTHTDGNKYRAVYFTSYRPEMTYWDSTDFFSGQDENNYYTSSIYWFKFEPIKWKILSESNGEALILSELILDSQPYQNCWEYIDSTDYAVDNYGNILTDGSGNKILANNYAYSSIRSWLNDSFYNTAFNSLQKEIILKTTVDNSASTTISNENPNVCENTNDNIFLLSYKDMVNSSYGYSNANVLDLARRKKGTEYSLSQGLMTFDYLGEEYIDSASYLLRSPCDSQEVTSQIIWVEGSLNSMYVNETSCGVVPAIRIDLGDGYVPSVPEKAFKRVDANGVESESGNYVLFGSYPQKDVTSSMKTTLSPYVSILPSSYNNNGWTSYGYYDMGVQSNYMWYKDVTHTDGNTYRAVYFTSYRPYMKNLECSVDNTVQYINGYTVSNIYWFKFEPIKWRILSENNGEALISSELILDSQAYQEHYTFIDDFYVTNKEGDILLDSTRNRIYANNYAYSTIRSWLNDSFYQTAFNSLQKEMIIKTNVDNSHSTTNHYDNIYACENTNDYVFLLSYEDVTNTNYGFNSDIPRRKVSSDYSKIQGCDSYPTNNTSGYAGCGLWWLRSPYGSNSLNAKYIYYDGVYSNKQIDNNAIGVAPALNVKLN